MKIRQAYAEFERWAMASRLRMSLTASGFVAVLALLMTLGGWLLTDHGFLPILLFVGSAALVGDAIGLFMVLTSAD